MSGAEGYSLLALEADKARKMAYSASVALSSDADGGRAMFRVGAGMDYLTEATGPGPFKYEAEFQRWLADHPNQLEPELWIVAGELELDRVERHRVDLLGVGADGRLVVIEVKRANATREAVGQVLDYISALEEMEPDGIADLIETASPYGKLLPVSDFGQQYADRFDGAALSMLTPARILLASTAATPATERILRYLREHDVDAESHSFDGHMKGGKRVYRRKRSASAPADPSQDGRESKSRVGRKTASKPGADTDGRRKIDEVHDGVEEYARANYAGAKLFTEIHGALVTALYEGTEERRVLTGESFGITVKMRATKSDRYQKREADYVTVRFYPHEPDHVRLSIFEAAWQRGGDEVVQLFNLWELSPHEGESQPGRPLRLIRFDRETWDAHADLFKQFLRNAKTAWEAERR